SCDLATRSGTRPQLHRHRRFVRTCRVRADVARGTASVSGRNGDRDQGRTGAARTERMDSAGPSRVPAAAGEDEPALAWPGTGSAVALAPDRSERSTRRAIWRDQVDAGR